MTLKRRYWEPTLCKICTTEEQDEYTNGLPECRNCGICKHLKHQDAIKCGLSTNPHFVVSCGGFGKLLNTLANVSAIDVDNLGLPTLRALGWLDVETELNSDDFAECVRVWLGDLREEIASKRAK